MSAKNFVNNHKSWLKTPSTIPKMDYDVLVYPELLPATYYDTLLVRRYYIFHCVVFCLIFLCVFKGSMSRLVGL